ncbi:MAG: hypothetical protein ABIC95_01800 [archaeon]
MDEKKRDELVKKMTVMLLEGKTHHRAITLLKEEGFTEDDIKQAISFLRIEDFKGFSEHFKKEAKGTELTISKSESAEVEKPDPVLRKEERQIKKLDKAIDQEEKEVKTYEKAAASLGGSDLFTRVFLFVVLLALLFFIFWVQTRTEANLLLVILGFSPFILTTILTVVIIERHGIDHLPFLWVVGIILVIMFFFVTSSVESPLLEELDGGELTAINVVGIMIFLGFISLSWGGAMTRSGIRTSKRRRRESVSGLIANGTVTEEWHTPESMPFKETVQSIEDKCKALNFVIGRVYGERHGGDDEMRDRIRIPSTVYNQFSTVENFASEDDRKLLLDLLGQIKERLEQLTTPEKDLFGARVTHLRNLMRDMDGEDSILTVLAENDKDPVMAYYESGLGFCNNAINSLRKAEKHD